MKVSIVVPYFNSSNHLDTIQFSIKEYLNREDIEIIFIDDCSQEDEYLKLLEFFGKLKANNLIIDRNEHNLGASGSRRRGVLLAKGRYIAFLDSDDAWAPKKIDKQLDIMEKNNFHITGCSTKIIEKSNLFKLASVDNLIYREIKFVDFLFKNYFSTPSVMVLRDIILKNNFNERLRYSEDYECWRRILIKNKGAIIENLGVYSFKHPYISNQGLSSNTFEMSKSEIIGIYWIFFNDMVNFRNKLLLPLAIIYSMLKSLRRFFLYLVK